LAQNLRKGRHTASAAFKTMEETEWKNATPRDIDGAKTGFNLYSDGDSLGIYI
jgi:hypothetical protein